MHAPWPARHAAAEEDGHLGQNLKEEHCVGGHEGCGAGKTDPGDGAGAAQESGGQGGREAEGEEGGAPGWEGQEAALAARAAVPPSR